MVLPLFSYFAPAFLLFMVSSKCGGDIENILPPKIWSSTDIKCQDVLFRVSDFYCCYKAEEKAKEKGLETMVSFIMTYAFVAEFEKCKVLVLCLETLYNSLFFSRFTVFIYIYSL